jgi:branched-chain amino acid transport system substrate-binding protein
MLRSRSFPALLLVLVTVTAQAEFSDGVIRIGVLTDLSGPYAEPTGEGSVLAARMAVEDFGAAAKGMKVEVVVGDVHGKPEAAVALVKGWYEKDKVDVVVDIPNTAVALAVNELTRGTDKALLLSGTASSDMTGKACSPNLIHWTYDTWGQANAIGSVAVVTGGKTWYFVTVDHPFGQAFQRDIQAAVVRSGGEVLGATRHPFNNPDFTAVLTEAAASKAKIIALANAGGDTNNAIKRAAELNIGKAYYQQLAGLLVNEFDIHKLGLPVTQGILVANSFYWDLNPRTRLWSRKFFEKRKAMPNMIQAGVYASVLHYLKAAEALRSDDGLKVVAKMKEMPSNDALFGFGRIRQDGRKIHRLYLFEVKRPAESKGEWDYYKLRGIVPADTAFRSIKDGTCPMIK